jgi:hypothetical protein
MPNPALFRRFAANAQASASVEFAINGSVFFLFIFALINLGDLGISVGMMKHSVEVAVREAVVQTGAQFAQNGNTAASCATAAQVMSNFNAIASPVLPAATGSLTDGTPSVTASWNNSNAANSLIGASLTVTARYTWRPIGMPSAFGGGIPITVTSTQFVNGTSGLTTSCN